MKTYNALIVDDEKNIREALELMLGQYCPEIHSVVLLPRRQKDAKC